MGIRQEQSDLILATDVEAIRYKPDGTPYPTIVQAAGTVEAIVAVHEDWYEVEFCEPEFTIATVSEDDLVPV
jgi:hypothetical protein